MTTQAMPPVPPSPPKRPAAPVRPRTPERLRTVRRRLAGVVFLVVPALLIWLAVAVYDKQFSDDEEITVRTGSVGNEMHERAEVKVRGVVVGEVRKVAAAGDGSGAELHLRIRKDRFAHIPSDVTAQMLPTTVFGQRYVALVPPAEPSAQPLRPGATIPQDRSRNAIELEQVLGNLLPTLTAVQPAKLSATLSAVSGALEGRGKKLGETLVTLDGYLAKLNPQLPALNRNIKELVKVGHLYSEAAPDILRALEDFATTSGTLAEKERDLSGLYGTTTRSARETTSFLRANQDNLIRLTAASEPTLRTLAEYAPSFPCTLQTLARFVPAMDKALGKGTDQPGLHVNVTTTPSRGKYRPGRDAPAYGTGGGPRCYSVPYLGKGTASSAARPSGAGPGATIADGEGGLGTPNSEQENRLVNELLAPELEERPQELPDWSSVLTGPALRGTEVTLK